MRAHPAANLRRALISPDYHYLPRLIPLLAFSPQQEVHCSDGVRKGEAGYRKGRQRNPSGQSLLSSHRHKGRTWCSNLTLQRYFGSMQHIASPPLLLLAPPAACLLLAPLAACLLLAPLAASPAALASLATSPAAARFARRFACGCSLRSRAHLLVLLTASLALPASPAPHFCTGASFLGIDQKAQSVTDRRNSCRQPCPLEIGAIGEGWIRSLARLYSFFNVVPCPPAQRAHAQAGARGG